MTEKNKIIGASGTDVCPVCKGVMRSGICSKECKTETSKSD